MKVVVTADQMMHADNHTIENLGIPGLTLMEHAARCCFETLAQAVDQPGTIVLVVGGGNNGGDGLAVARMLLQAGFDPRVFTLKPQASYKGDAAENYQRLLDAGVEPQMLSSAEAFIIPPDTQWIVDALFGTGLKGGVRGVAAQVIEAVNASSVPVLAIDLPSGLSGNHGRALGSYVRADVTVTFQNLKLGHVVSPACLACGRIEVRDIGIQFSEVENLSHYLLEPEDYARKVRPQESHKGSFGSLGIVGGFAGMTGAANLVGLAAMRFGVGKARIWNDHWRSGSRHDSLMTGDIANLDVQSADAWVVGPGLSRSLEAFAWIDSHPWDEVPVVWDADALYFLEEKKVALGKPWVMTPHPGEAAHLLKTTAAEIQKDRLASLRKLAETYPGGWIVLKGYRTLVHAPDGEVFVIGAGNAALATAGAGDVLAGMIGALLASGNSPDEAVLLACLRHGLAADRWIRHYTDHSMLAEDIVADLKFAP